MPIFPTDAEPLANNLIVVTESSITCLTSNAMMEITEMGMAALPNAAENVEMELLIAENCATTESPTQTCAQMLAVLLAFFLDVVTMWSTMVRSVTVVLPIPTQFPTPAVLTAPNLFAEIRSLTHGSVRSVMVELVAIVIAESCAEMESLMTVKFATLEPDFPLSFPTLVALTVLLPDVVMESSMMERSVTRVP